MRVDTALQVFIDETRDEYYAAYECTGGEELIELQVWDLVPLPFTPAELKQGHIKVFG